MKVIVRESNLQRFKRLFGPETPEQQKARQLRAEIYAHNLTVDIKRKQRKERNK